MIMVHLNHPCFEIDIVRDGDEELRGQGYVSLDDLQYAMQDQWIDVNDRLPEYNTPKLPTDKWLIATHGWVDVTYSHPLTWNCLNVLTDECLVVTHWQPLPSPPRESDTDRWEHESSQEANYDKAIKKELE